MKLVREYGETARLLLVYTALFGVSFCLALIASKATRLPFHGKYGIESSFQQYFFNPNDNLVQLFVFAFLLAALFFFFVKLYTRRPLVTRYITVAVIGLSFFFISAIPSVTSQQKDFDTFHKGEQLSPALAYVNGKSLYSDISVLHGAGDDVVLPAIAFKVFGTTIGSYLVVTALFNTVAYALFFYLLLRIIRPDWLFYALSVWFFLSIYSGVYYIRDIFVWTALILMYATIVGTASLRRKLLLSGTTGAVAGLCMFYAVDRGQLLLVTMAFFAAALCFFNVTKKGKVEFSLKLIRSRYPYALAVAGGYVFPYVIGLFILGAESFGAFLKTTFHDIPQYQGILFSHQYPPLDAGSFIYWFPFILLALFAITIVPHIKQIRRSLTSEILFGAVMLVTGLVFLKAATGRPDPGHLTYATPVLLLSVFYLSYLLRDILFTKMSRSPLSLFGIVVAVCLLFSGSLYSFERLGYAGHIGISDLKAFVKAPSRPDGDWLPPRVKDASAYITARSKPSDGVFVFSSEPTFYYATKRPNPTSYYISWFMDPDPIERESLAKLKTNPPKFIVYKSNAGFYDAPDDVSMEKRLPLIDAWIKGHYKTQKVVDGVIILSK